MPVEWGGSRPSGKGAGDAAQRGPHLAEVILPFPMGPTHPRSREAGVQLLLAWYLPFLVSCCLMFLIKWIFLKFFGLGEPERVRHLKNSRSKELVAHWTTRTSQHAGREERPDRWFESPQHNEDNMARSKEALTKTPMTDNFLDNTDNNLYGSLKSQLMKPTVFSYTNMTYMDSKDIIPSCHLKKNPPVSTQVMGTEHCKFKGFRGKKHSQISCKNNSKSFFFCNRTLAWNTWTAASTLNSSMPGSLGFTLNEIQRPS